MKFASLSLAVIVGLSMVACSATEKGDIEDVKFCGFLKDYSQLKPGDDEHAGYIWVKPALSLAAYRRIMLDTPQVYVDAEQRESIGEDNLASLVSSLNEAMREELGAKWDIVDKPGPGVLRLRMAISNASRALGGLTPFTRILPWGVITSGAVKVVSGEWLNQGEVTGEMEITDARGQRLAAAVDRRVGGNNPLNVFSDWGDVKDVFSYWGERVAERLEEFGMVPTK